MELIVFKFSACNTFSLYACCEVLMALIDYIFGIILVVGVLISSWDYFSPIAYEDCPSSVDAETVFA